MFHFQLSSNIAVGSVKLPLTGNGLAKDGLLQTESRKENRPEQKTFSASKLHKKMKRKNFLWILLTECSKTIFTPSFANTLLSVVFFSHFQEIQRRHYGDFRIFVILNIPRNYCIYSLNR